MIIVRARHCALCDEPLPAGMAFLRMPRDAVPGEPGWPAPGDRVHPRCFHAWPARVEYVTHYNRTVGLHVGEHGMWTRMLGDGTVLQVHGGAPGPSISAEPDALEKEFEPRRPLFARDPSSRTPCLRFLPCDEDHVYSVFSSLMICGYRVRYPELLPVLERARAGDGVVFRVEGIELGLMGIVAADAAGADGCVRATALAVWPEYRDQGVGSALVEEIEEWSLRVGGAAVSMPTDPRFGEGARFLVARGYVPADDGRLFKKLAR